jgi:hypothetical protein
MSQQALTQGTQNLMLAQQVNQSSNFQSGMIPLVNQYNISAGLPQSHSQQRMVSKQQARQNLSYFKSTSQTAEKNKMGSKNTEQLLKDNQAYLSGL